MTTTVTSSIATIMDGANEFTIGFIDMMGDAVDAFMSHETLMIFMFAIPLAFGAIMFVRGLIKKRKG